jgi:hypothetical protein
MPWYEMEDEESDIVEMWDSIKAETDSAYLFGDEGFEDNVWLPKSQVKVEKLSRGYSVQIPKWLARKKGLV